MGYVFAIGAGIVAFIFGLGLGGIIVGLILAAVIGGFFWWDADSQSAKKNATSSQPPLSSPSSTTTHRADALTMGHFVLRSNRNEVISPKQYGYWSVHWAIENASGEIADILKKSPSHHPRFAKYILENEFLAHMQFIALYAAAYWVYATDVLKVPAAVLEQMQVGINDGVKDLRNLNGQPVSRAYLQLFEASFSRYFSAIQLDLSADANPHVVNPAVNELAKCAVTMFRKLFPQLDEFAVNRLEAAEFFIERTSFSHMVADLPLILFGTLKEILRLEFEASPTRDQ